MKFGISRALAVATALSLAIAGLTPAAAAAAAPPQATSFVSPLAAKSYTISSWDGPRCMPLAGASTYHNGIDLAARGGDPIYAIAAGVVTATVTGTTSRNGYITVRHHIGSATYSSVYYHMWDATTHVKVGQTVKAGQRISQVGTSGSSTGNHLHLEIWQGSKVLRPTEFLQPRKVDLVKGATMVTAKPTPPTCTYYTTGGVNLRAGASTSTAILTHMPAGTAVVAVPGKVTNSFLPVKVGSRKRLGRELAGNPDQARRGRPAQAGDTHPHAHADPDARPGSRHVRPEVRDDGSAEPAGERVHELEDPRHHAQGR